MTNTFRELTAESTQVPGTYGGARQRAGACLCSVRSRLQERDKKRWYHGSASVLCFAEDGFFVCFARRTKNETKGRHHDANNRNYPHRNSPFLLLRPDDRRRTLLPPSCDQRQRLRPWRKKRRSLADRLCLRHLLFLCRHLRRLRRSVRMELRTRLHLDRSWQRLYRIAPCLEPAWQTHASDDPTHRQQNDARLFLQALRLEQAEGRRVHHRLYFLDPLHRFPLQRSFQPL